MQDRADYIRQVWAERETLQVKQIATQKALQAAQAIPPTPPTPQSDPPSPTQQPNSLTKKKRNQRTRKQYKQRKAKAQRVTIQEMEHSYGQEMEHLDVQISVEKVASKHEALIKSVAWNGIPTVATSSRWHTVIPWFGMALFGMILVQNGVICMRRIGVG